MGLSEADLFTLDKNTEQSSAVTNSIVTTVPQKPYLSNTIDYDVNIAPYQLIKIYSGVGSGKNTFVNHLVKGDLFLHHDGTRVRPMYIWLISSRKAKILETLQLQEVTFDPYVSMFDSFTNDWMAYTDERYASLFDAERRILEDMEGEHYSICLRSCVNTNAKVEHELKKRYTAWDPTCQPWNRFDMIIVDEAHSLISDATYQSSGFYVRRLIQETLKHSKTCKVILMTGSPKILEDNSLFPEAHLIDRMETCINVQPKSVCFITKKEANEKQKQLLKQRTKFVAFFNHVDDMLELDKKKTSQIRSGIAMSFSKKAVLDAMKKQKDPRLKRMLDTQVYLAQNEKLPEDVTAFLSTSKNKEGINIKNDDIHVMFTEAHAELDVIQMAGRLRNPVDMLYVVVDSQEHNDYEDPLEYLTTREQKLQTAIKDHYLQICRDEEYRPNDPTRVWQQPGYAHEELKKYIDFIHRKYPYLRYDYFTDCFRLHYERYMGRRYYAQQKRLFAVARESKTGLVELANSWFPGVPCTVSDQVTFENEKQIEVDEYFEKNGWMASAKLLPADRAQILSDLNRMLKQECKELKPLLKKYGYDLMPLTNSHKTDAPRVIVRCAANDAA